MLDCFDEDHILYCYAECRTAEHSNAGYCYAECYNAKCRYAECINAGCRYDECCNAECRYAECHGTKIRPRLHCDFDLEKVVLIVITSFNLGFRPVFSVPELLKTLKSDLVIKDSNV